MCCCVKSTAAWIYPWTDPWVCQVGKGTFGERKVGRLQYIHKRLLNEYCIGVQLNYVMSYV